MRMKFDLTLSLLSYDFNARCFVEFHLFLLHVANDGIGHQSARYKYDADELKARLYFNVGQREKDEANAHGNACRYVIDVETFALYENAAHKDGY